MIMLFAALLAANSYASVQNPTITKTLDGKIARCEAEYNIGKPAYRPSNFQLAANETGLGLSLVMESLECTKNDLGYFWQARPFNAPTYKKALDGTPVVINVRDQEFRMANSQSRVVGGVPVSDETSKEIIFNLELAQLISASDQAKLEGGQTVNIRMELFLYGISSYTMNGKTTNLGQTAGGSYAIQFQATQSANGLVFSQISFQ